MRRPANLPATAPMPVQALAGNRALTGIVQRLGAPGLAAAAGNRATVQLARFLDRSVRENLTATAHSWEEAVRHAQEFDAAIDKADESFSWRKEENAALAVLNANAIHKARSARGQGSATALEVKQWKVTPPQIHGPGGTAGQDILLYEPGIATVRHNFSGAEVKIAQSLGSLKAQLATAYQQVISGIGKIEVRYVGDSGDLDDLRQWESGSVRYQVGAPQDPEYIHAKIECNDRVRDIGIRRQ